MARGFILLVLVGVAMSASCGGTSKPASTARSVDSPSVTVPSATQTPSGVSDSTSSFSDAAAYCDAVGTIDAPDARWMGAVVPGSVRDAARAVADGAADTNDVLWRCLGGSVFWCVSFGTNWCPKGDAGMDPIQSVRDFCARSGDTDNAGGRAVAGLATIYQWGCRGGVPAISKQLFTTDTQGFVEASWHKL